VEDEGTKKKYRLFEASMLRGGPNENHEARPGGEDNLPRAFWRGRREGLFCTINAGDGNTWKLSREGDKRGR